MCKYEMDPTSIVEDTERTWFCPQRRTDGQGETSIPPFQLRWSGRYNDGILLIGPLWTNFSEILIEIHTFSFKEVYLKICLEHDGVIKWKHFPCYWDFVRGIHQWPVNCPHKGRVMRSFDVFFDMHLKKQSSKQSRCPLCRQFTGHWWIPLTEASDAELWCFLWSAPEQTVEQTIETPLIWDAIVLIMTSL